MILFDELKIPALAIITMTVCASAQAAFLLSGQAERVATLMPVSKARCCMKNAVKNFILLLWASVYLVAMVLTSAVREIRDDIRSITGKVSLIRSILFLCFGVCAIGYAGVVIALLSR